MSALEAVRQKIEITRVVVRTGRGVVKYATTPDTAKRQYGVTPTIAFIRDDGWTIGCTQQSLAETRALWLNSWRFIVHLDEQGYGIPLPFLSPLMHFKTAQEAFEQAVQHQADITLLQSPARWPLRPLMQLFHRSQLKPDTSQEVRKRIAAGDSQLRSTFARVALVTETRPTTLWLDLNAYDLPATNQRAAANHLLETSGTILIYPSATAIVAAGWQPG